MDDMKWEFKKAVPLNDCRAIVYVMQFTERDFHFDELPPELGGGQIYLFELAGQIVPVRPDEWLVWFPKTVEFTNMPDREFQGKYTLYENLPPKIKALADKHPSYNTWVAAEKRAYDVPIQ